MPRIVVRDTQSGFVGATGTILTIEPDGTYERTPVLMHARQAPLARGVLDEPAREAVVHALEAHDFASLPARLGCSPAVANPHEIAITVGDKTVTLVMSAGLPSASSGPGADDDPDMHRFLAMLLVIREHTKPPSP